MHHLSSSWTIFLRLFIPVFWMVFFGSFAAAIFIYRDEMGPVLGQPFAPWIFLACYLSGIAFIYLTFWRLYRVDADDAFFYVTNYFKTYKYPFHQIVQIEEQALGSFPLLSLHFSRKFSFGKNIWFIANKKKLQLFLEEHADQFTHLLKED